MPRRKAGLISPGWTTIAERVATLACQSRALPGDAPDARSPPLGQGRAGSILASREAPGGPRPGQVHAATAGVATATELSVPRCGGCARTSWSGSASASSSSGSTPRSGASSRGSPTPASTPRSRSTMRELRARYGVPRYTDDDGVEREAKLAVIGMGKLGGEELNFSSDVDVIYVYSSDQGEVGGAHAARVLREAVHAGHRRDVGGHRGRRRVPRRPAAAPRGRARARSRTRSRRSSATTRRSAGRGSARRGSRRARAPATRRSAPTVLAMLRPFVFPRLISPTVIDDVRDLNRRIKRELVRPRKAGSPPASISRTARAGSARSSSSCRRCS